MASALPPVPTLPKDPSRFLATRIDHYAYTSPSRIYASVPRSEKLQEGFRDITYALLARAVDRAAAWLDSQLGKEHAPFECFAYFGPRDLRYVALIVASIKTGRLILLPSHVISSDGVARLFDSSSCKALVFGDPPPPSPWFDQVAARHPHLRILAAPDLSGWFSEEHPVAPSYPYSRTWDAAINDPVFILHSSGTTGPPKLITYRNSTLVCFDAQYQLGLLGTPLAISQFGGKRVWSSLSMAHLGGIYANIFHPIYFHTITVLGPPDGPIKASVSDQMILHGSVVTGWYPPFILDEIATRPESIRNVLQHLESIQYGTAPLNKATAKIFSAQLNIQPHYASTELTFPPYFPVEAEDWEYFRFHPFAGIELCHRYGEYFEMLVVRKQEYLEFQPVFTTLPERTFFYTNDLWSPHPAKPNLWKYRGRTDDLIVLSTGCNVHTAALENVILENPRVRSALVGGAGRTVPYLIIELVPEVGVDQKANADTQQTLDDIWPSIEAANELMADDGIKFTKQHIILAPQDRPFCRLTKGSVDRHNTTTQFKHEIEQCYS